MSKVSLNKLKNHCFIKSRIWFLKMNCFKQKLKGRKVLIGSLFVIVLTLLSWTRHSRQLLLPTQAKVYQILRVQLKDLAWGRIRQSWVQEPVKVHLEARIHCWSKMWLQCCLIQLNLRAHCKNRDKTVKANQKIK